MNNSSGFESPADVDTYTTTREDLAHWVVFTTVDASGMTIKRVGFPKRPIIEEDELRASLLDDELYKPA